jgi:hypothetical protein
VYTTSVGATDIPDGWKGVGVGEAFGFAVTITIGGGGAACIYTGNVQATNVQRINKDASRRGCFIKVVAIIAPHSLGGVTSLEEAIS